MTGPDDMNQAGHLDHGGITCRELVALVTAYLDEALPAEEASHFEQHLRDCPPCVVHLEQIRETVRITGSIPAGSIDPDVKSRLMDMFRDWRADPRA